MKFDSIEQAIKDLQRGKFIIVVDDEDRENEGDIVLAAEKATPSKLNYMIQWAGGLMCMPVVGHRLDELKIPLMVPDSTDKFVTPFTISVDAKKNTTTGMSVNDRMETIKVLLDPKSKPEDLARPGHMFPLRAAENGVFDRAGHTESSVDLCKLAGLYPAAIIAEVMNDDGSMAKLPDLEKFAEKHELNIITIKSLIEYRKKNNV
ncbi:MAG: 3,4-dihydroxy-2-butanone-4-phosphate synthase [Nanoarchaeota archaeon]|nr:3,4-dihydroxy-2-butanone-4-phosphate synthase [Nanoarchaeota archaeon]MBU1005917.1 3,4-dihydroxy-2-butanone-4-phosphate synthase [Nanoarchaeota archaeon]MBU1945378.1 3,4-dihydroxy-2-butanone-4-phosphate synthase [Nanoarchaeota archaeon]